MYEWHKQVQIIVDEIDECIKLHNDEDLTLRFLSRRLGYSEFYTTRKFKEISDMPLLCMPFPMIKDEKKLELAHTRIYETIEDYLRCGQIVGMLTIGDPGIYSTYLYMHKRAKENGWQAEILNGVPSFCAVAAKLGISLGEKKEEIHIIPAAYEVEDTFSYSGTCVYMKSGKRLAELLDALRSWQDKTGKIYEVWGVSNCGMAQEQVYYGLDELEKAKGYLTTVIAKQKK